MARIQMGRGAPFRKILYSWPVLAILAIMLAGLGYKTFRSWQNYRIISQEYEKLQKKISEVEESKKKIDESLALLADEYGRDRVIREQFDVKKPDENVIIILDQDDRDTNGKKSQIALSFFSKIVNFVKDLFIKTN